VGRVAGGDKEGFLDPKGPGSALDGLCRREGPRKEAVHGDRHFGGIVRDFAECVVEIVQSASELAAEGPAG